MENKLIPMDQKLCNQYCQLNQNCQHNMDYQCKEVFKYFNQFNSFGQLKDPKFYSLISQYDYLIDLAIYELDFVKPNKPITQNVKMIIMSYLKALEKLTDKKSKYKED